MEITPISSFRNRKDAERAQQALAEAGIESTIREPHETPPGWRIAASDLRFTIWVPREFDDEATRIVHRLSPITKPAPPCDVCGKEYATIHTTNITTDASGKSSVTQKRHLCEGCAKRERKPEDAGWAEKIRSQVCDWCGKPATGGGNGPGWERFYCTDCGQEWGQILRGVYANFPKPSDPKLYSDWVTRAMREADGTMRKRLRRRR